MTDAIRNPEGLGGSGPASVAATRVYHERHERAVHVVLVSTYELGRQPFGVASAAAWLRQAGASVACLDTAVEQMNLETVADADVVAFYVPMHTATRIAIQILEQVKQCNPHAHLCFFGLYAPVNEAFLRKLGAETILGGEFEEGLVSLVKRLRLARPATQPEPVISLARQRFLVPDRRGLPPLERYAHLKLDATTQRTVGYTEASRGCKHLCRHCPIVPVYRGRFRIVPRDVVLADVRQQIEAGARHITFGDPDFFNGPGHAIPLVEALHREHPDVTYDVTIKIEHLLAHAEHLPTLRNTGCLFVTTAVESVDDRILELLEKRHTREDFVRVVALFRELRMVLCPTFVTFTPWTTTRGYRELLALLAELDLVSAVPPVQLAIRLLIPAGSRLLELPFIRELVGSFDERALCHPWVHPDPEVDRLYERVLGTVKRGQREKRAREAIFREVWAQVDDVGELDASPYSQLDRVPANASIPHLTEPWFC
jgi:radical SAM superfamily enzyme YgiQ (UPF0313 family)